YPILTKSCFTMFSAALIYMLILVSEHILLMGTLGVGLMYAARGIGSGIGPVVGRNIFPDEDEWVKAFGLCMVLGGLTYAVVGLTKTLWVMIIFVFIAHMAAGTNWTMSTVLLQRRSADHFRGRVFSTEWLIYTLARTLSVFSASVILEY